MKLTVLLFIVVIACISGGPYACNYYKNLYNRIFKKNSTATDNESSHPNHHTSMTETNGNEEEKALMEEYHSSTESENSKHSHETFNENPDTHYSAFMESDKEPFDNVEIDQSGVESIKDESIDSKPAKHHSGAMGSTGEDKIGPTDNEVETPHSEVESDKDEESQKPVDGERNSPTKEQPKHHGEGTSISKHKPKGKDGGATCGSDDECLSKQCYHQKVCLGRPVPKSYDGKKMQRETCADHDECYSGHCIRQKCETDSPVPDKMGRGGRCTEDHECFCGFCIPGKVNLRVCSKDSAAEGKVGSYGKCNSDHQCFSGVCHDEHQICSQDTHAFGKVGYGGYCRIGSDCLSKRCVQDKCIWIRK